MSTNFLAREGALSGAIVVSVGRMFNNLASIRRYYLEKWTNRKNAKKEVETTNVSEQTRDKEKQE